MGRKKVSNTCIHIAFMLQYKYVVFEHRSPPTMSTHSILYIHIMCTEYRRITVYIKYLCNRYVIIIYVFTVYE